MARPARPALTVVGSVNLDLVLRAPRLPRAGETVTGATFAELPGGKGANQALAAQRLGADVALVGRVGDDSQAAAALAGLRAAGVDVSHVVSDATRPTGIAAVTVSADGENQIVVAPGANAAVGTSDVSAAMDTADGSAAFCQLEINDEAVVAAAELASELFCVNAAPARSLPSDVWARADVVIVNEVEREQLSPELVGYAGLLVTTLGAEGATLERSGEELARAAPPPVAVVDTTGAGDAFSAAFVVGVLEGRSREDALERACAAGALATTHAGAQAGLPTSAEVDKLLA